MVTRVDRPPRTPANDRHATQGERRWPPALAKAPPLKVLLVEDSAILRVRIENMIAQQEGLQIAGVAAGEEEALAKLAAVDYDAIILDVELRPGSGISVIRHASREGSQRCEAASPLHRGAHQLRPARGARAVPAGGRGLLPRQDARVPSAGADLAARLRPARRRGSLSPACDCRGQGGSHSK